MHKQEQDSGLIQNSSSHQNVLVALFSLLTIDEPDGEHAAHIDISPSLLFWTSAISEYS